MGFVGEKGEKTLLPFFFEIFAMNADLLYDDNELKNDFYLCVGEIFVCKRTAEISRGDCSC